MSPALSLSLFPGPGRFVTPDQKYSMDNTPHTPTPFKNALEKYGPLKPLVRDVDGQVCAAGPLGFTWQFAGDSPQVSLGSSSSPEKLQLS